jgi:ABC-2 type transport system ATP-binding protein
VTSASELDPDRGRLALVDGDAPHGDAPGLAGCEQHVGVDVRAPAEEVRLGIVRSAAVDGGVEPRFLDPPRPGCDLVGAALRLLRSGTLHVSARHSGSVPDALTVRNLQKRFGSVHALRGVDLQVGEGELVGLLGPNGAGKSTLVKIAVGLVRPSGGDARVAGAPAGSRVARRSLGYLAELFRFPGWYTADEVLELHQRLAGSRGGEAERKRLLELVALADAAGRRVDGMSKGMQQRLGVAQALVGEPRLLLLDEPTSALDPVGRRTVRLLLEELRGRGISVLLNSHLLSEIELVCDRVAILLGGELVAAGSPHELSRARGVELETDEGATRIEGATREDAPRLVAEAVAAGRKVYGVRVLTSTLEEVYLEAVGEETS